MKNYLWALSFLTVLPVPQVSFFGSGRELAAAASCFPLAGATLGAILAGAAALFSLLLPPGPTVALLLALNFLLTRGLHCDGLADTADGLIGALNREKALAAMEDSAVGVMGAASLLLLLLLKYSALLSVEPGALPLLFFLMPLWGRWAIVCAGAAFGPARPEGLGALFLAGLGWRQLLRASLTALALTAAAAWWRSGLLPPLSAGLLPAAAGSLALAFYASRRLGGLTGDVLGAVNETGEVLFLLGLLAASSLR